MTFPKFMLTVEADCPNCGMTGEFTADPDPAKFIHGACFECQTLFLVNFDEGLHLIDNGPTSVPLTRSHGPALVIG